MLKALCQALSLSLLLAAANAQAASVVFLNPGFSHEAFWVGYSRFMQAAAQELGMDLRIEYSERRTDLALAQARAVLTGPQRPDYSLGQRAIPGPGNHPPGTGAWRQVVLVNNGLTETQARSIQAQPDRYAQVLGTLTANDEQAGYQMLRQMVAMLPPGPGPVDLVAFAGVKTTPASQLREQGMRQALADFPRCACARWSMAAGVASAPMNRPSCWQSAIRIRSWCGLPTTRWLSVPCRHLKRRDARLGVM